jgi:hypothetical protein
MFTTEFVFAPTIPEPVLEYVSEVPLAVTEIAARVFEQVIVPVVATVLIVGCPTLVTFTVAAFVEGQLLIGLVAIKL